MKVQLILGLVGFFSIKLHLCTVNNIETSFLDVCQWFYWQIITLYFVGDWRLYLKDSWCEIFLKNLGQTIFKYWYLINFNFWWKFVEWKPSETRFWRTCIFASQGFSGVKLKILLPRINYITSSNGFGLWIFSKWKTSSPLLLEIIW